MDSVQSSVRAKVKLGEFPAPTGAESFPAYAVAWSKRLFPEMENAARRTLDLPMTFEVLGEGLRLFDGLALRDLIDFRKRCRNNFVSCLEPYFEVQPPGPSSIWVGCPEVVPSGRIGSKAVLPRWLTKFLMTKQTELILQEFTNPLDLHSRIRGEYFTALQNHGKCYFCLGVHIRNSSTFCAELENKMMEARDKVILEIITKRSKSRRVVAESSVRSGRGSHLDLTYPSPRNQSGLLTRLVYRNPSHAMVPTGGHNSRSYNNCLFCIWLLRANAHTVTKIPVVCFGYLFHGDIKNFVIVRWRHH